MVSFKYSVAIILCISSMLLLSVSCAPSTSLDETSTVSKQNDCVVHSGGSCSDCVDVTKCFYCESTKKCEVYPYKGIVPKAKDCTMSDIRWGTCAINFLALIIGCSVVGGILLIGIIICCCCCCCRKKKNTGLTKLEMKWERQKEERKSRSEERRAERKSKTDEIKRKYGLLKEDNPYKQFES